MNIREVEQQLGIPRANVRYYEKEGLLHPERSANNYRVYTDEDVETLKKIKLLRWLDMPVETIRAVQAGEVALSDALERQERLLESEAVKLERAREVCRSMLADGAAYPSLDPARYEGRPLSLPGQAAQPPKPKRPPVEGAAWAFDPWQRYWARAFDVGLCYGIMGAVLALVFHVNVINTNVTALRGVLTILGWLLALALEPLLLCTWGTTPGKWLLGLELRSADGGKLSFSQGLRRTWGVLWTGYGLEIPGYSLYRLYQGYKRCRENASMDYDFEEDFQYYSLLPDRWVWRAMVSVALSLLLIPAQVWFTFQSLLPPNRGDVTVSELAENVNKVADYLDYALWVNEEGFELSDQSYYISHDGGPMEHRQYGEPFDDEPVYTVETDENGFVTAVCMDQEGPYTSGGTEWVWLPTGQAWYVLAAFRGAWCSGFDLMRGPVMEALDDTSAWDGRRVQDGRFTLTIALEQKGYQVFNNGAILIPEDGGSEHWYSFSLRLEKTQ